MAIVDRVITLHNGTITVQAQHPSLAFIITLPFQRSETQTLTTENLKKSRVNVLLLSH